MTREHPCVKAACDLAIGRIQQPLTLPYRPITGQRPLVAFQYCGGNVGARFVERSIHADAKVSARPIAKIRFGVASSSSRQHFCAVAFDGDECAIEVIVSGVIAALNVPSNCASRLRRLLMSNTSLYIDEVECRP